MKIGDDVLVLQSSGGANNSFSQGQVYKVSGGNQTDLQGLVSGGLARVIGVGGVASLYVAVVTQASTAAPVAVVRDNSLSATPVWARSSEGTHTLTLAAAFTSGKTFASCDIVAHAVSDEFKADFTWTSADVLTLHVRDSAGNLIDGFSGFVTIKVYS